MSFTKKKLTFALYFGNRGFFPGELIAGAREELQNVVTASGYDFICMDENKTRYGAVETIVEGKAYAEFLAENKGKYDGVILCLPNFGDENGGLIALRDAGVPILVQAYPDEIGKMDFAHRRDAYCGKFAMCNVLRQAGIPFTLTTEFVCTPSSTSFQKDLERFAAICRVAGGMKRFNIGSIGARTTAFKTVRADEIALQSHGINVDTVDLADVFRRMGEVSKERTEQKIQDLLTVTTFGGFPREKLENMAKFQAVAEDLIAEYNWHAVAVRCWNEFQLVYGIAPCTTLSLLNEMGVSAACEVDIPNAVMMRALSLASDGATMLLDFNNNYGADKNKAVAFHCGPIAPSMAEGKGTIIEHLMFKKSFGEGTGVGVNKVRIKSGDITVGSVKAENGKISAFAFDAKFTDDPVEEAFFGSGKVIEKQNVDDVCNYIAESGYKHHVCITFGHYASAIKEALTKYLGYAVDVL